MFIAAIPVGAQPGDGCAVARAKVGDDREQGSTAPAVDADGGGTGDTSGEPISEAAQAGLGFYDHEHDAIMLSENWAPPVVHHLVMHQFTAKHMGWPADDAREMRALFEGLAMIMERLGGYRVEPPRKSTLADSLALPGWTGICDAGKQLVRAFDKIASATSQDIAKDAFINAIRTFKDLNGDGEAWFGEFVVALIRAGPGFEFTRQVVIAFDDFGAIRNPRAEEGGTPGTPLIAPAGVESEAR